MDGAGCEWRAGVGVGCDWVPGVGVGSDWGPWVCVVGVGQGGLCVVKSGGKVCLRVWGGADGTVVGVACMSVAAPLAHRGVEEYSMRGWMGRAGRG